MRKLFLTFSLVSSFVLAFAVMACGGGRTTSNEEPVADSTDIPIEQLMLPDTSYASVEAVKYVVENTDSLPHPLKDFNDRYEGDNVMAFRKNLMRNASFGGKVTGTPRSIEIAWEFTTDYDTTHTKFGVWGGGSGWTGQPLYVKWTDEQLDAFRQSSPGLTQDFGREEIIVGSLCGKGYFINYETGKAFELGAGDSIFYHSTAAYLSRCVRHGYVSYIFKYLNAYTMGWSDQGYTLWLTLIYTIFGPSLLTPRLLKALMSAYLSVVVYKLGSRTFGERVGRLAAVMMVFTPILVQSCGLHTKEMEMIFLSILALERMDNLIRSKKYNFWNIFSPILFTALTFGFRTIIGMCLIFAFLVFVMLSSKELVSKKAKIITIASVVIVFFAFLLSPVGREMKIINRLKFTDLHYQTERYAAEGLKHSELAQSWILAPGAFVLPLSPMVEEAPDHNKMIHGSTYVTSFVAFFAMLAIRRKDLKIFYVYCGLLFVALVVWNWLKLSARGMV